MRWRPTIFIAALTALFLAAVYVPDLGRGFVKDDFRWIAVGRSVAQHPFSAFVTDPGDFYRPLVSLAFAADTMVNGLNHRHYGFTNLLLCISCLLVLVPLLRQLGASTMAATAGAFVWALNPHSVSMAVLWLSGRTSLLMVLFSCLSVLMFLRRRSVAGAVFLMAALLSKEDAVLLPLLVLACQFVRHESKRRMAADGLAMLVAEFAYFALRVNSHAMTVATAPAYYQLTWDPALIGANFLQYVDRALTPAIVFSLVVMLSYGRWPSVDERQGRALFLAAFWFVLGIAITVRVPVRSSLYALFPSIGGSLAFAMIFDSVRRPSGRGDIAVQVAFASVLLLVPMYNLRNDRYVEAARVSSRTIDAVVASLPPMPDGRVVLEDESKPYSNFHGAFSDDALTEALRLYTGRPLTGRVVNSGQSQAFDDELAHYRLISGRVDRVR